MNGEAKILIAPVVSTRWKALDYLELMKPELTSLSVLTALCGYYLATVGAFDVWGFIPLAIGTALVGGGAGALNEYIEREYDALMRRTERRPIPSGRIAPVEGLVFGLVTAVLGILLLAIFTNVLTGLLSLLTFVLYLFVYTPLKRITPLATVVGGIPGALPPVMGWTAVRSEITLEAWVLFAILFFWQMPHFFSLAWMYRKDYARAGFKLLTVDDVDGFRTSRQILLYSVVLVPASIVTSVVGLTGPLYLISAVVLGSAFLYLALRFAGSLSSLRSRRLFFASLVYLPLLFFLMALDKV
jgi:protoheme IX farnesyltransferase